MVANIRELAHEKRIEGIAETNDESDHARECALSWI